MSTDDEATIERAQPYHWRMDDDTPGLMTLHPLIQLEALNNADKHRLLHPAIVTPSSAQPIGEAGEILSFKRNADVGPVGLEDIRYVRGVRQKNGTEVLRVRLRAPGTNPEMEMQHSPTLVVSLSQGDPFLTIDSLRNMFDFIEEQIFKSLSPTLG